MKTLIFITLLTLTISSIIKSQQTGTPNLEKRVGSPTENTVADQLRLDPQIFKINQFIRANVPEVEGLKLISYTYQVVAGIKYFFTYDSATKLGSSEVVIQVLSRPWENFLQVTRPNGTTVQKADSVTNKTQNPK